jgi:flagellar biosynthesis protein FlhG
LTETRNDQADGLRRMFSEDRLRVVHVVAGCAGVGRLSVALNLGVALAKAGRDTMLIDVRDDRARSSALDYLGLEARAQVGASRILSSIVPGPHGLAVLPLTGEAHQAPMRRAEIAGYCASFAYAIVTDTSTLGLRLLPIEQQRSEVIVVLSRAAASITEAYALIKRMSATGACRRFHVLVNRVGSESEAMLIFRNMARVARGYLDVELELLGFVPADAAIEQAAQLGRSLLDTWPQAASALAFKRLADRIGGWALPRAATHSEEPTYARAVGAA